MLMVEEQFTKTAVLTRDQYDIGDAKPALLRLKFTQKNSIFQIMHQNESFHSPVHFTFSLQIMEQVQRSIQEPQKYTESNCFLFVIICHAMEDGCLMDTYQKMTFKLNELAEKVCAVTSLDGKPKMILIEEYGSGRSS